MTDAANSAPAVWYDGVNALRHEGEARWDGADALELSEQGAAPIRVPLSDLRFAEATGDRQLYRRASLPDFRLRLPRPLPGELARNLPAAQTYGGWIDRFGLARMAAIFAVASAAAVALFLTAPQWLGPMVPWRWEQAMGDAMVGDFGNHLCRTPQSDRALAKLLGEVDPGDPRIRLGIADIGIVNAVTLPGGHVLLFNGIIQKAKSPDELAGVLAHEVGHVRERHVMTALLRQFGLSILLSGANTNMGNTAFGLTSMSYSRKAEAQADKDARAMLARADIAPNGTADFFERLEKEDGGDGDRPAIAGWLASHPASSERAKAFRASAIPGKHYRPALTAEEFAALKNACKADKSAEPYSFF